MKRRDSTPRSLGLPNSPSPFAALGWEPYVTHVLGAGKKIGEPRDESRREVLVE